jgi:hypothetical protein
MPAEVRVVRSLVGLRVVVGLVVLVIVVRLIGRRAQPSR